MFLPIPILKNSCAISIFALASISIFFWLSFFLWDVVQYVMLHTAPKCAKVYMPLKHISHAYWWPSGSSLLFSLLLSLLVAIVCSINIARFSESLTENARDKWLILIWDNLALNRFKFSLPSHSFFATFFKYFQIITLNNIIS